MNFIWKHLKVKCISTRVVVLACCCYLFATQYSFAVVPPLPIDHLPASVEPAVLGNTLAPKPQQVAPPQPISVQKQKSNALVGKAAQQIRFKLTKIVLVDNTVYTDKQLLPLYQDKLNKLISISELQEIVQDITNYYRNNGYILTRAILPPQHVSNGVVYIRILEGYIDQVRVVGDAKRAKKILLAYGQKITQSRPLKIAVIEHYLRLANQIPGMQVKAVLEPSKTAVGASDLNLTAVEQTFQGYVSYDNYGTLYIGPNQMTGSLNANSILQSGDTTRIFYITTTRPQELKYVDLSYTAYIGAEGVSLQLGGNNSKTQPGLNLAPLKINGVSTTYYGLLSWPLLRMRDKDLTVDGGFNYLDSQTTEGLTDVTTPLYTDHIRSVRAGGNFNLSDKYLGSNFLDIHAEKGLNILGATSNPVSLFTSRFGANGIYTKITTTASRTQQLFHTRYSVYLMGTGQYSFEPLLASAQVAFGGSQLGRGYSPAEIIGDRGAGGTIELRMDLAPGLPLLQALQPYLFYDVGVIWNIKNIPSILRKQSITSAGGGVRISVMSHLSANLMVGQPLTKQNSVEEVVGNGRRLQGYFSITAYI